MPLPLYIINIIDIGDISIIADYAIDVFADIDIIIVSPFSLSPLAATP